ncbi:MAG: transporter substrate-binding domain-containing protein [Arcobacteraceae bacterium]
MYTKILLFILFLNTLLSANFTLTDEEKNYLQSHSTITITNDKAWIPFDYQDDQGKPAGYSIDLLSIIEKKLNIKFEYVHANTWNDLINKFKNGEIDLCQSIYKSNDRLEYAIFSKPYHNNVPAVFQRKGLQLKTIEDLNGKTLVIPKGFVLFEVLKKEIPDLKILEVNTLDEALYSLASNKADFLIESATTIQQTINQNGIPNVSLAFFPNLNDTQFDNFALRFATLKENPVLLSIIQKAYDSIEITEIKKIQEKWFGTVYKNQMNQIALTPQEEDYLAQHPTIKVSNEMDFPPFDFAIGKQPFGYSIDLMNLIAQRIGLNVEYINGYSWKELLLKFKNKEIDMLHTAVKNKEREKFALFSDVYFTHRNYFFIQENGVQIKNMEDLKDKKVALGKGWSITDFIITNYPEVQVVLVENNEEILRAVSENKADVGIASLGSSKYILKKKMIKNVKVSGWVKEYDNQKDNGYRFVLQKNATPLQSMINKALESLTIQDIEELEKKWFGEIPKNTFRQDLQIEERILLEEKTALKICVNKDWMPYEQSDDFGVYEGISANIMKIISQKTELPLEVISSNSIPQTMTLLQEKKCDIVPLLMYDESKSSLNFTKPYISQPLVIVTRNDELFISNIKDIKNKKVAIIKSDLLKKIINKKYPNLEFVEVNSPLEGLLQVENNSLFGYIGTPPSISYNIQKESLLNLKISGKLDLNVNLSIASGVEEPLLQKILEKALDSIGKDEKNEILNSWYKIKYEKTVDYDLVWKIIFISLIIILVFSYWTRKMTIANKEKEILLKELQDTQAKLKQLAITDKLTSLYNRNKLDDALDSEFHRTIRYKTPFGVILLDIDFFKKVNDTYGHQVGDKVLIEISNIIKLHSRESDVVGRWGGEEFLIICPHTNIEGLKTIAEKIRKEIEDFKFVENIHKTASFGVSEYKKNDQIKDILSRADKALYIAKNDGRNRVICL